MSNKMITFGDIARGLGLQLGEEFRLIGHTPNFKWKFTEAGVKGEYSSGWELCSDVLERVISGRYEVESCERKVKGVIEKTLNSYDN